MTNSIRHSLASKLTLSILLLTVPVFVVSLGILFTQSRAIVRQEAQQRAASVLNTTTQRLYRHLETIETATNVNAWLITEHLQPDSLLALTRLITLLNGNVDGCSITTEPGLFPQYGRYFSAYSVRQGDSVVTEREKPYEYFDKVWYKTPRQLGHACWVEPFDDYTEGSLSATDYIASYCRPLYLPTDSQFIGVIATDVSLRRLTKTIFSEQPYPHSYFIMIGEEGNFFVHPDSTLLFNHTIFSGADPQRQSDLIALGYEMSQGKEGSMRVNIDGERCLVSYKPLRGTSWSLALVCPDRDILQAYHRLTFILLPLVIIGLVVILLLCRRGVALAVRPVNRLLALSQQIAEGHYDQHIPRSERRDVVGRLQNSFAAMQESLQRHIHDIHQANEEAARRNDQLADATYMAEEAARQKTLFIQNMTHQIRTPLNIIAGFAQVLRNSFGTASEAGEQLPQEEVRAITDMMKHNATSLHLMVLMLYDSSDSGLAQELASHKQDPVSCNLLAQECAEQTRQRFPGQKVGCTTTVADSLVIHTNRTYLTRTILELLYNAVKYSDKQHVAISVGSDGSKVSFTVEDTGPGMDSDYLGLMYTPFTKANDLSEGLGLGLPLCRRHILNLGGNLTLDANYHDGCRFVIELPIG